jgi:hypothetical protein
MLVRVHSGYTNAGLCAGTKDQASAQPSSELHSLAYVIGHEMEQQPTVSDQTEKPRGHYRWPKGVSGNPLGRGSPAQRVGELITIMRADFRGKLSGIETSLLEQAARLLVRAERTVDHDVAVRAAGAASRLLMLIQRKRRRHRRGPPSVREQRLMEAEVDLPPLRERIAAAEAEQVE